MSDFSTTEKINASWKHLFGILGTNNTSPGKQWYEETLAASHIVASDDIWATLLPIASTLADAKNNAIISSNLVEDRSDGIVVSLVQNISNWDINCSVTPKIGFQLTNQHPNPTYIKSITNVINNGGNSYTITLSDNTGVSAGSAVLQRRVFLTSDPSTNGLAWFARQLQGNTFSGIIPNFIQPQKFGKGYTVRLFQANGTEILTTQGAWIFNWQKGLMLFATGATPQNLSYAQPIYIEGFRYVGPLGTGTSLPAGNLNDTLRFDGSNWVPTSGVKCDGPDLSIFGQLTVSGAIVLPSGIAPLSSDPGQTGEFRWDGNFLYFHNGTSWKRSAFHIY